MKKAAMETILQDLRYGLRSLLRSRWSTVVTILSLALGIGVNCVVLTCYKAFFLRPLDAHNAGEMVNIALTRKSGIAEYTFSYPDYQSFSESVPALSGLIAYRPQRLMLSNVGEMISQRTAFRQSTMGRLGLIPPGAGNAEFAQAFVVSENYFKVLGASVVQGRTWNSTASEATPSVLVSENYWRRRFAGDPAIVGKRVYLNGVEVTVIGVTPRDFVGTSIATPAFFVPVSLEPLINADKQWLLARDKRRYQLYGRLAPGATAVQAQAQITTVADRLWTQYEAQNESNRLDTRPAAALVWPGSPWPFPLNRTIGLYLAVGLILFGTAMVLGVACANVGSLQLARARSRETEFRTRLSLGATRVRVVRQLITESALVGLLAGALALLLSWALLKMIVKASADFLPVQFGDLVFDVNPNLPIFALVFSISLIAGVLSGLTPAMHSTRSALTSIGRGSTASVRNRRLEGVLVSLQVAFSLVLMISGTMFIRGAVNALGMEPGYDSQFLVRLDFQFPEMAKYTADRKTILVNELRQRTVALSGVKGVTRAFPPGNSSFRTVAAPINEQGATAPASSLNYNYVEPDYFETLGIPLLLGRAFDNETRNGRFVILSESAARQVFGRENPIGRRIRMGLIDERQHQNSELVADGSAYQVVGVAGDTRGWSFDGSDSKQIYIPLTDDRAAEGANARPLLLRTNSDAASMIPRAEEMIASIDPGIVVTSSTLEEARRQSGPVLASSLAAAFAFSIGVLGLLLALTGIFGTVSHIVALRTREVGIRMALGARQRDVLRLILHEIARSVCGGLVFGMTLAAAVVYLLRGALFGISVVDAFYFVLVSILFLIAALLAAYPPARQATRVDPMAAVRCE
jgi:putative ABC transport system permease protein